MWAVADLFSDVGIQLQLYVGLRPVLCFRRCHCEEAKLGFLSEPYHDPTLNLSQPSLGSCQIRFWKCCIMVATLPRCLGRVFCGACVKAGFSRRLVCCCTCYVGVGESGGRCACVQNGYDVFNALDLMDNKEFLEKLKFGIGDGNLQYYLYNWRCSDMPPNKVRSPPNHLFSQSSVSSNHDASINPIKSNHY